MPKFIVTRNSWTEIEVDAANEDEAIDAVVNGEGTEVHSATTSMTAEEQESDPLPKYLRIDLLEPISGDATMEPDDAMTELRDYLLNEFDNKGIQAVLTICEEPAQ